MSLTPEDRHAIYLGFLANLAAVVFVAVLVVILRPRRG